MAGFLAELRQRHGVSAPAVELVILKACRSGEVRGMRWGEVDLDAAVWTIPGKRMKAGKLHRVPLSAAALLLLRRLHTEQPSASALVFPGAEVDVALSDMSLTAVLRQMNTIPDGQTPPWCDAVTGKPITVHGFRSTFRVWAGERTPYSREVVEAALAHTLKDKVEAAYKRSDLLERRRPLMEEWATFCSERRAVGVVVPIRTDSAVVSS